MDQVLTQWKRYLDELRLSDQLHPVILASWESSRASGGDAGSVEMDMPRVADDDLQRRLAANAELMSVVARQLDWLTAFLQPVPHVISVTDREGVVLDARGDHALIERLELSPGRDWSERAMGTSAVGTALATGQPVAVVGPAQSARPFHDRACAAAPILGPGGEVVGAIDISTGAADGRPERVVLAVHIASDIGRELLLREQAQGRPVEEQLRESVERYRTLVEAAPDGILINQDNQIVYANPAFIRLLRADRPEQVVGQSPFAFIHPAYHDQVRALVGKLLAEGGQTPLMERQWVRLDGDIVTGEVVAAHVRFQGRPAILVLIRDITERRRAERGLRESEERVRLAMDAAQVGTWDWDIVSGNVVWSDNLESYMGMSPGSFAGSFDAFRQLVHPDDRAAVADSLDESLRRRQPYHAEFRMVRPDGSVRWTATRGRAIHDADGLAVRMLGVDVDITERKLAEDAVRSALAERETLLKEIHHRVKNNLQVISSLLHLQSLNSSDTSVAELFRDCRQRVRSMALVHERLYRAADLARVDFAVYVEGLATDLFRSYRTDPGRFRLEVAARDVRLPINAAVPCGLLVNELISNCLKHAFAGREAGRIRVELGSDDGQARLEVSDDGVGLPADLEPASATTFGWQLIAALVDQLHGRLELDQRTGTTVRVIFPLAG